MKPDDAIKPDAHLRAALRHAPDADDAAPADISAQIIAAAHRSAGERPALPARLPAARGRWWLQPWGASGALATVVMAGVIGLMWRGEAPGPARESAAPQVAQAPTPTPTPTTTTAPATADAQATPPAPAPTLQPAATRPRVLAAAPAIKPAAKPAVQSMAAEPSETVASARDAGAAAAAAPPAPAALAAPPAPPPAAAANLRTTQRAAQEQSAAASPNAAAPAAPARLRALGSAAPQPPWRTAPQPGDQFSWQPEGRMSPPDATWLARLAEQTAGRWQPLSVTPTTAEVAQLHWQRNGTTFARLGFDRDSVWWCGSVAPCERAALDAAALRELLARLAR